ncbi:MAG: DPP IV N-terminal domain-containing protein [Cyanobacteria bacterium P01_H01_bin.21]
MNGPSRQPLDRLAQTFIVLFAVIMSGMVLFGGPAASRVRDFTWQNQRIGADDTAFLLTFSRPMDQASVEQNLTIDPPLPGRFSWAGRRMAYTLDLPAPYGNEFKVNLPKARDRFSSNTDNFVAFESDFQSRERAFAYIGIEGEEQGRLMLYNLSTQEQTALTPENWTVLDYKPYTQGDRILFAAVERGQVTQQDQQLYTVTTGLGKDASETSGQIETILDSNEYQNLKFDLSPDGQTIVVQRVGRDNPGNFGPWVITQEKQPRRLETEPGGDFMIAPDSQSLLLQQGEGTAIIALGDAQNEQSGETLDFLPQYGLVMDVANNGSAAAMISFNQDDPEKRYTQTLFWVSSQGDETPLLTVTGSILDAQFDPTNDLLFCLTSELLEGDTYQVQPSISAINLETGDVQKLQTLPPQPSVHMSLAPDGLALLFDQTTPGTGDSAILDDGVPISASRLWLLPLYQTSGDRLNKSPQAIAPQAFPFAGINPAWIP